MKKLLIIILLVILNSFSKCLAQEWVFNAEPFFTFQNDNLKSSYGLQIGAEYLTRKNIRLNLTGGLFSPDNNLKGVFIENIPTTISWIDIIVKLYPLKSDLNPYFGLGIGRYFLSRKWTHGVEHEVISGNLNDKMGYQFVSGLTLYKSLFLELRYFILSTEMDRLVQNGEMNDKDIIINLNTFLIAVGVKF